MDLTSNIKKMYENWQANSKERIMFGEHELDFDLNDDLDEFFLQKAQEELRETPEVVAKGYEELQKLIAETPDLMPCNAEIIYQIYLRPCKWYAKSAYSLIKRFKQYRQTYSRIFIDLLPTKQKKGLCSGLLYPLPLRAKDGCRIVVIEAGKVWKPREVPVDEFWKGLLFLLFAAILEPKTQIAGARVIIDVEGMPLSHVTYITPGFAKMMVDFVQKCLPARLKSIHIVNQSFIFNMAYAIFKPFLEEKIRKRILFHGTNWEALIDLIGEKTLLKKHGGKIDMPDEGYGVKLWHNFLAFEPIFEVADFIQHN